MTLTPTIWDGDGQGSGELQFLSPLFKHHSFVVFKDYRDQLELPSQDWFHEPVAVETRQCVALHAGAAVAPVGVSGHEAAAQPRLEMLYGKQLSLLMFGAFWGALSHDVCDEFWASRCALS